MSLTNPFAQADAWDVSTDTMLPVGNHVVTIIEADDQTAKSSGNPQLHLKMQNENGSIQDWVAYHGDFLGKIVSVFDAAGIERPGDGEFDPDDNYRLTASCIRRVRDKKVGIVIREEEDNREPGKMRKRVQGYVTPDKITGDIPADTSGLATATASSVADDDIPF